MSTASVLDRFTPISKKCVYEISAFGMLLKADISIPVMLSLSLTAVIGVAQMYD